MSGDAHVRKRGVDKRRKKVEEAVEDTVPLLVTAPNLTSDENIHVHKDAHLGGNFCTKIVFFCLFGTLTLLVGLLIIEFQGSGDVESTVDSPWSVMLEGWVDEQHDDHGDEEHSIPDHSEEEESENEVGFDSYGVEESDHEDDENEENEVEAEDLESDAKSNEGFGFYKSIYQSIYSEKDTSDDDGRGDSGENNDEADQNGDEEEDDQNENEEDDQNESEEEDDQNESEEEDSQNEYNDNEPSQELDSDDLFGEKNDDDYYGDNNSEEKNELDSTEEENNRVKLSEEEEQADSNNKFHSKISHQTIDGDEIEDGDDDDDNYNNEMIKQILARSQEKKLRYETSKERPYETEAEEHIRNVMNGLRKKKLEEEVSQEVFDEELLKESQEEEEEEEEAEAESEKDEEEIVQEVIDDDDSQETVGVILKFGVGVALIVVAHVVLIRKWNSWENSSTVESAEGVGDKSDVFDAAQIIDRRDSLVDLDSQLPTPSGSENEVEEEETPEESEDEQLRPDNYISRTQYEASATPVDSEVESNAEMTDEEADDNAHDWKTKEIEAQTETEEEEEDEEEEEEEEEESPPPSPPKPKQEPSNSRRQGGVRSADVDFEQEYYEYSDITNEYDWNIRNELDFAEDEFLNGELGN